MKSNTRACIACIAGCIILNKKSLSVYDYSQRKYVNISGNVDNQCVNIYDYEQMCHISGNSNGVGFSLYHYGDSHHIDIKIDGNGFNGYDYGSSAHFSGQVSGNGSVSVYDYEKSSYFNYSV